MSQGRCRLDVVCCRGDPVGRPYLAGRIDHMTAVMMIKNAPKNMAARSAGLSTSCIRKATRGIAKAHSCKAVPAGVSVPSLRGHRQIARSQRGARLALRLVFWYANPPIQNSRPSQAELASSDPIESLIVTTSFRTFVVLNAVGVFACSLQGAVWSPAVRAGHQAWIAFRAPAQAGPPRAPRIHHGI